jgi:hypothetical protein
MAKVKSDLEIQLPFDGYYHSVWDQALDSEMEQYAENYEETDREEYGDAGLDASDFCDIFMETVDWKKCHDATNRAVVDAIQLVLDDELDIKINLEFSAMESPRFYNFSTDRLFAKISRADVAKLVRIVRSDRYATLRKVLEERHTSRSGFASFYSNDLATWLGKRVSDWDHNELESLLLAAAETKANQSKYGSAPRGRDLWTDSVFYRVTDCDSMYHEFECGVDWDKFEKLAIERRTAKAVELGLIEENAAPEKLARRCDRTADMFR